MDYFVINIKKVYYANATFQMFEKEIAQAMLLRHCLSSENR